MMYIIFMLVRALTLWYYSLIMIHLSSICTSFLWNISLHQLFPLTRTTDFLFPSFLLLFSKLQTFWRLLNRSIFSQQLQHIDQYSFGFMSACITAFILHLMCYKSPSAYVTMWGLMIALYQLQLTAADLSQWHFLDA